MILRAYPESTWMRPSSDDPIYLVKYKGLSCFPSICMSSGEKVMHMVLFYGEKNKKIGLIVKIFMCYAFIIYIFK